MSDINVTNRDILLQLQAGQTSIQNDVAQLRVDVAEVKGAVGPQAIILTDHETRLRSVERFKNAVPGVAVLSLFVAVGSSVFAVTH